MQATPMEDEARPSEGTRVDKDEMSAKDINGESIEVAAESNSSSTNKTNKDVASNDSIRADAIVRNLSSSGKLSSEEKRSVQGLSRDHAALKVKVDRLKALLGRSAKAQREAKVELECSQKKLDQALRDVQRLKEKVEHLSSRPTHLDLLNDFETNFDKALLSVGTGQTGGQDIAAPQPSLAGNGESHSAVDTMLIQELEETRQRLVKLELLNSSLIKRSSQLETESRERKKERDAALQKLSHMELELRMSRMEALHAHRAVEEKAASLEEMQMEIDLVTKASMKAYVRAAQGEAVAKSSKTDRQRVLELEAQVQALQEWALASTESKRLALERVSLLEKQLKNQFGKLETEISNEGMGRTVLSKSRSLVIGAGDMGHIVVEPEESTQAGARLLLRWKFDVTPSDVVVDFNVVKGKCTTSKEQNAASYIIKDRAVKGGAEGTLENAFTSKNACTLLWSNKKSWIRPRTVKCVVEVISLDSYIG